MSHTLKSIATTVFFVSIVGVLGGFVVSNWAGQQATSRAAITVRSHALLEEFSLDELIAKSDRIVTGTITNVYPSRWNTPDGILSPGITAETISPDSVIFTESEVTIDQSFKGDLAEKTIRVRTFGGIVGQDRMVAESEPELELGQTYILFLSKDTGKTAEIGPEHYLVTGAVQGAFKMVGDMAVSEVSELPLTDLLTKIQSGVP